MGSYFLDTIRYAMRRKLEQWQYSLQDLGIRDWANDNPVVVMACTAVSAMVLLAALTWSQRSPSVDPFKAGRKAWFYDQNTEQLFKASSKNPGPINAPSGPLPDGNPSGVRAHVYSYIPEPNEADLFIGFLETPAPERDKAGQIQTDADPEQSWAQNRLIKRPEDDTWVLASSVEGRKILSTLSLPNTEQQTPIYQKAK